MFNFNNKQFAEGRLLWCNSIQLDRYKGFGETFCLLFQAEE